MKLDFLLPSKAYIKAIKWLEKHGKRHYEFFDYPEYAGMPKKIANNLGSDEVDKIQDNWELIPKKLKNAKTKSN